MTRQDLTTIRDDLQRLQPEFSHVLPPTITAERFARVALTAVQRSPGLLECSRRSLFLAIQQCAEDGLLPDGKQAVLLPMKGTAVYIPMVRGVLQKLRDSADIADIIVELVRDGDMFSYSLGDTPRIIHEPDMSGDINRPITHVYSIVKFKDGAVSRCVMAWGEVLMIRDRYSRAQTGPWYDRASIGEMGKKTVIRRHAKLLPTTPEFDRVLERDDQLFDLSPQPDRPDLKVVPKPQRTVTQALDAFASEEPETNWVDNYEFKSADDYIEYLRHLIDDAQTPEAIDNIRVLWKESTNTRRELGITPQQERVLSRHIRALQLPDEDGA